MKGIDISAGSGVDFRALKDAGYDFVIARAGWGSAIDEKQVDIDFWRNVEGALNAGLHLGAYWFIYAQTVPEAKENAVRFANVLSGYKGAIDMPVYIDYEYDSTRYYQNKTGNCESKDFATAAIFTAAAHMESEGWYTGIYLNPDYIKNHVNFEFLERYTLWLAEWKSLEFMPSYNCGMWQYAGDAQLPGIATGKVDLDVCYIDFPQVIRERGLNGFSKSDEIITPPELGIFDRPIRLHENGTWEFGS